MHLFALAISSIFYNKRWILKLSYLSFIILFVDLIINSKEAFYSECFKGSDKATYTNDKLAIGHCDISQKDTKMGDILYIALKQGFF